MQVIYSITTATNDNYGKKYDIETVIPYRTKTTFIVRGDNETQCLNKLFNYFSSYYFTIIPKIECAVNTYGATILVQKFIDNEYYCRTISILPIKSVKDKIFYL